AQMLHITFEDTFQAPKDKGNVADGIKGTFGGAPLTGLAAADKIVYQGFVNNVAINPPAGPVTYVTKGTAATGQGDEAFGPIGHGPMAVPPPGGPPWTLKGDLTLTLNRPGEKLFLKNSADVAIAGVPEPSTIALLGVGLVGVMVTRRFLAGPN